jgi:S1-C subfamily serine protease
MDPLDAVIVVVAVLGAFGGYRLGFFTRVLSWVGLALGIYLGARFLPRVISSVRLSSAGGRLLLAAAVLIGAAFVGQALGMLVGSRLHGVLPAGPMRSVDKGVGGVVGVVGVVVALWLLLPSVSSVTGWPARATRESAISRWVSNDLPAPPDAIESLRHLVGDDEFPEVFTGLEPGQAVGPPPAANPLGATVTARVAASTVKVEGQACNRIQDGSGFAVAPNLVLTNAHVVAGEPAGSTDVVEPSGRLLAARVVLYDPNRDVALLAVAHLDQPALPLAAGHVGTRAAVFGHPEGQIPLAVQPASVAQAITATGRDLYDRHDTSRRVFILASHLEPGDSGGPLVDRQGRVIGVAFAIALDRNDTAYALTTQEIDAALVGPRTSSAVSTEGCLAG